MAPFFKIARNIALLIAAFVLLGAYTLWRQWQIRDSIDNIGWPMAASNSESSQAVTATWLGTTSILFDDGETQLLIDGAFTKLHPLQVLTFRPVRSDIATINFALSTFAMDRLAAIIPVHSHFDHAMDIGYVANRTSAVVLGSESTANIVRGAAVPVAQYQILADGESREFGAFRIRMVASQHAPINAGKAEYFAGVIERPLEQPAPVSAWKTGVAWSIFIEHPRGTTLVQGSGGFIEGKLANQDADIVMLGIGAINRLGKDYVRKLWVETVEATHASRVIAIHHDDYTKPFGEVELFPNLFDKVTRTTGWIEDIRDNSGRSVTLELPPFGVPISLY